MKKAGVSAVRLSAKSLVPFVFAIYILAHFEGLILPDMPLTCLVVLAIKWAYEFRTRQQRAASQASGQLVAPPLPERDLPLRRRVTDTATPPRTLSREDDRLPEDRLAGVHDVHVQFGRKRIGSVMKMMKETYSICAAGLPVLRSPES
jgi:hypothetical protein